MASREAASRGAGVPARPTAAGRDDVRMRLAGDAGPVDERRTAARFGHDGRLSCRRVPGSPVGTMRRRERAELRRWLTSDAFGRVADGHLARRRPAGSAPGWTAGPRGGADGRRHRSESGPEGPRRARRGHGFAGNVPVAGRAGPGRHGDRPSCLGQYAPTRGRHQDPPEGDGRAGRPTPPGPRGPVRPAQFRHDHAVVVFWSRIRPTASLTSSWSTSPGNRSPSW